MNNGNDSMKAAELLGVERIKAIVKRQKREVESGKPLQTALLDGIAMALGSKDFANLQMHLERKPGSATPKVALTPLDAEFFIGNAQQHGEDSEPDHEVGDLQDFFRIAYNMLPDDKKEAFALDDRIIDIIEPCDTSNHEMLVARKEVTTLRASGTAPTPEKLAEAYGWEEVELRHALDNLDTEYGDECIIALANGRFIHCPAYPEPCDYVRITQDGYELGYWDVKEWEVEGEGAEVMGAILGAAHGM